MVNKNVWLELDENARIAGKATVGQIACYLLNMFQDRSERQKEMGIIYFYRRLYRLGLAGRRRP